MNSAIPRDQQVFEILEDLEKIKDTKNKVEWLQTKFQDHTPLMYVLKMNYCGSIMSMLPEGIPPYSSPDTEVPSRASLWQYLRVFPVFVRSVQSSKMKMLQIEQTFIEMLEAIDQKEAEVICLAKDRKLEEKYSITQDLVNTAFPNLIASPAEMPKITPLSPEERANNLLDTAKELKQQAKKLNDDARELEKEAKEVLKVVKNDNAAAA
jgi:hypothetical protein